ncbi:ribosomal protein L25 (general stress protein Ctc) [secondary endosymbiont of Heteropsylla cubana]|uniref:Large ribosomal subunit protein bL25 n=1 Tax=secondary endosymbiont of Heteropsylla cubana TaxID=134287 RepID=J3Z5F7_9ENTR|nr:50S ribosomal protein L25 [secondary endosymbiont of Heteropsylla cubana]AFP85564.1 ribosomal protein L25 (general stress protein Ctc) [secondary endosymbiont of Heteropsylla cubana]
MLTINAALRREKGKGASRRLRLINRCPAIVYGGNTDPIAIELDHDEILNEQQKKSFYVEKLILIINNKENTVKVQFIQRHPFKPKVLHIDFIRT